MTELIEGRINDRWPLMLTPDRVDFHAARPQWEAGRLASCAERIEPGMVVYDVGAECGDFTALYKSWAGTEGDVIPVEPQPAYWPSIKKTWEANHGESAPGGWFLGFAAAATVLGPFTDALARQGWPDRTWPRCSHGRIQPDFGFRHLAQQADDTAQARLDHLPSLLEVVPPDVIVMDVEGAEFEVIKGCSSLLEVERPLLYVSFHAETMRDWYGATFVDMAGHLANFDYEATELPYQGEAETFWLFSPR